MEKRWDTFGGKFIDKVVTTLVLHISHLSFYNSISTPTTQHFHQTQKSRCPGKTVWPCESWSSCAAAAMHTSVIVCWIVHACSRPLRRYLDLLLEWFIIWDYGGELQICFLAFSPLLNLGKPWFPIWWMYGVRTWNHQLDWHLKHCQVNPHIDGPIWQLLFNWAMKKNPGCLGYIVFRG